MSFGEESGEEGTPVVEILVPMPFELIDRLQAAAVEGEGGPPGSFHFSSTLSDTSSLPAPTSLCTTSSHSVASGPQMEKGGPRSLKRTDSTITFGSVRKVDLNHTAFNVCSPTFSATQVPGLLLGKLPVSPVAAAAPSARPAMAPAPDA